LPQIGPASPINCELLQLALHFIQVLTSSELPPGTLEVFEQTGLIELLVEYLREQPRSKWSSMQLAELRRLSIAVLCNLSLQLPDPAALAAPVTIVLDFISAPSHPELREGALRLLIDALSRSPALQQPLGEAGAVSRLIALVGGGGVQTSSGKYSLSATSELLQPTGLSTAALQDVLVALSLICNENPANQNLFGEHGGVRMLLPLLLPTTETRLLLAAIDCMWSGIVPSPANTLRLVESEGVLQLISCLESGAFAPRAHLLSCLADLLVQPTAAEQCHEWRGKQQQSSVQLLLQIWAEEEARLGEAMGSGMLRSTERPLSVTRADMVAQLNSSLRLPDDADEDEDELRPLVDPLRSQSLDAAVETDVEPEAEAADALASGLKLTTMAQLCINGRFDGLETAEAKTLEQHDLRAKVYAVLAALGFSSPVALRSEECLLLEAAKEYVLLCDAEAWRDVDEELNATPQTRPVSADAKALDEKLATLRSAAEGVLAKQQAIVEASASAEAQTEAQMVGRVRVLRDGPLGQLQTQKKGTRSMFRARLDAKAKLGDMVAASHVKYRGPVPTVEEYADAAVAGLVESVGKPEGLQVKHAAAALGEVARTTGAPARRVGPYLAARNLNESTLRLNLQVQDEVVAQEAAGPLALGYSMINADAPISATEVRDLCVAFQSNIDPIL